MAWNENDFHKGGPIERYELNVTSQRTGRFDIFHITGNETKYQILLDKFDLAPDCTNSSVTNLFNFTIRSVTKNSNKQEFSSNWSSVEIVPAYCKGK